MITRHWFPVIATGATLFVLFACVLVYTASKERVATRDAREVLREAQEPALEETAYQNAVRTLLTTYTTTHDAKTAYDTLLYLAHVPRTYQDVHLGLVAAFGKLASGDSEEGAARLEALRAQYSWLVL